MRSRHTSLEAGTRLWGSAESCCMWSHVRPPSSAQGMELQRSPADTQHNPGAQTGTLSMPSASPSPPLLLLPMMQASPQCSSSFVPPSWHTVSLGKLGPRHWNSPADASCSSLTPASGCRQTEIPRAGRNRITSKNRNPLGREIKLKTKGKESVSKRAGQGQSSVQAVTTGTFGHTNGKPVIKELQI